MKKTIALIILTAILLTSCAACGDKTANLNMLGIGDSFTTSYHTESGQLCYTINNIQWSDNVRELGVDPNAFDEYASVFGGGTSYVWPNYVDLETGQLKEHLMFVLVDLTVTNIDALVECARAYDNATIAARKMIISQLIERVDVYRDYRLKVTFRINMRQLIDALERLGENMVSA